MRELHDQLSRYVQHVRDGGAVIVTTRGRQVARLVPVEDRDPLAELRSRGLVREPTEPRRRRGGQPRLKTKGGVSELVSDQRR